MAKATNNNTAGEGFTGIVDEFEIDRVRKSSNGQIYFTLILNGVHINGCYIKEWGEGRNRKEFISLPSYKGTDGKYYNHVYFRFSDEDQAAIIDKVYEVYNDGKGRK